jgi:uncharacterized protein YjbI with pentapeptide repeats
LGGADLRGAVLVGTKLEFATLEGADMTGVLTDDVVGKAIADLPEPIEDMLAAHARWAETHSREGRPADLCGVDLRPLKELKHRQLTALIATGAVLYGLDLTGALMQGAQLEGADLRGVKLTGADLRGANLKNVKLANADLRDVNLGPLLISKDRLLPARLERCDARYADFRGADLRQAVFSEGDLAYADLTGAKLRATDFRGAILQGIKLSLDAAVEAIFDETRYDAATAV